MAEEMYHIFPPLHSVNAFSFMSTDEKHLLGAKFLALGSGRGTLMIHLVTLWWFTE